MVWYSHLFQNFAQFIVIHTVKGFSIVNKAEIDVFLELSCLFDDPSDVGNLISQVLSFIFVLSRALKSLIFYFSSEASVLILSFYILFIIAVCFEKNKLLGHQLTIPLWPGNHHGNNCQFISFLRVNNF